MQQADAPDALPSNGKFPSDPSPIRTRPLDIWYDRLAFLTGSLQMRYSVVIFFQCYWPFLRKRFSWLSDGRNRTKANEIKLIILRSVPYTYIKLSHVISGVKVSYVRICPKHLPGGGLCNFASLMPTGTRADSLRTGMTGFSKISIIIMMMMTIIMHDLLLHTLQNAIINEKETVRVLIRLTGK